MRCQTIQLWTFIGLVGAFLDLAIAFLLLCASFLAYIVSKLLGLFGLCLPCPCNGLFGNPKATKCFQMKLVDSTMEKISSVQLSVRTRFPFDTMSAQGPNLSLLNGRNQENECSSMEGAASCSSFYDRRNKMKFYFKGKGAGMQRVRNNLRRRKIADHDPAKLDAFVGPQSPASVSKMRSESNEGCMIYASTEDGMEAPLDVDFEEDVSYDFQLHEPMNGDIPTEKNAVIYDDPKSNAQGDISFDENSKPTESVFEQELEQEHTACAALSLELERERSAAASAADEAMAMILRLQEEKASIEMEARQFHRMIEEKSAYDAEEMNILKEILVRREREKHFLEKEVESYREMIFGIEQLDADVPDSEASQWQGSFSSLYSNEDPVLMQQHIKESIGLKEEDKSAYLCSGYEVAPIDSKHCTLMLARASPIPELDEDAVIVSSNDELHDKDLLSVENDPYTEEEAQKPDVHPQFYPADNLKVSALCEGTIASVCEGPEQIKSTSLCEFTSKTFEDSVERKIPLPCKDKLEEYVQSSRSLESYRDPFVHDVHVIDDKLEKFTKLVNGQLGELSTYSTSPVPRTCDSPTMHRLKSDSDINKSWSGVTSGFPPVFSSQGRALLSDLRRNSMSAVDYERFKIDNEVERLRVRLRIVQEGREKLNFSVGSKERKKVQLQFLEDIFCQLREIQQLTGSEKAGPQTSLPHLSSKICQRQDGGEVFLL